MRVVGTVALRFMARVSKTSDVDDCWLWEGAMSEDGYGRFSVSPTERARAHRWSYEHFIGEIPEGLQLDHLCKNRACVNPTHLDPVTSRENSLRSDISVAAKHAAKTHCSHGHPFDEKNTIHVGPELRWRDCLTCRKRRRQQKRMDAK